MKASDLTFLSKSGRPSELQVWHGDTLIGHLDLQNASLDRNSVTLACEPEILHASFDDDKDFDLARVIEHKTYRLAKRARSLDRFSLEREGSDSLELILHSLDLPQHFDVLEDIVVDQIRFSWSVVVVCTEEYEDLFDDRRFVPQDVGGPDMDRLKNDSMRPDPLFMRMPFVTSKASAARQASYVSGSWAPTGISNPFKAVKFPTS